MPPYPRGVDNGFECVLRPIRASPSPTVHFALSWTPSRFVQGRKGCDIREYRISREVF